MGPSVAAQPFEPRRRPGHGGLVSKPTGPLVVGDRPEGTGTVSGEPMAAAGLARRPEKREHSRRRVVVWRRDANACQMSC